MQSRSTTGARGFTLAEVLMALTILSVAFLAMIKIGGQGVKNTQYLRDKTFAHWVGMNHLTDLNLRDAWPKVGEQEGQNTMGQTTWYWQQKITPTTDPNIRRVDIFISNEKKATKPIASLVGFVFKPIKEAAS